MPMLIESMDPHLQIFLALVTLMATWSVIILTVARMVLKKCVTNLETKINPLLGVPAECKRLEIEILKLKADLPLQYTRKEDFIRFEVVINRKLDKLRDLVEKALRGGKDGED
jgi:hypothetical protein